MALLALLQTGCLLRAKRDEPPLVGQVKVEGNQALGAGEITSKLALTESGYRVVVQIGDKNTFEPESVRADTKRIERIYQSHGYYDARVVDVRTHEDDGRMNVTFVVEEGKPARIRQLELEGLSELPPNVQQAVTDRLPLAKGDVFDEALYDQLKLAVRERLRGEGYAEAQVDGRVVVDKKAPSAAVFLHLVAGRPYRISRIHVFGAQAISRSRISDATDVKDGDLLTPRLIADAQRRVYVLGVFSLVQVEPGPYNRADGTVPLIVTVNEAPFLTYEYGVGVEIDPTRQLGRVRVLRTNRNVNRGLLKFIAGGSAGYAFLPTILTRDKSGFIADLRLELVQPRIYRSPVDVSGSLDYSKDITQAFAYQRVGARVGTPFLIEAVRGLSLAPSLNFDQYFDVSAGEGFSVPGTANPLTTSGCGPRPGSTTPDSTCRIFYGELRVNFDRRDDQLSAHHGIFLTAGFQLAGTPLSEFSYWRLLPEARGYISPRDNLTLALRVRGGLLDKLGGTENRDPPGFARFFAGGANSVRATAVQQLGPRAYVVESNPDFPKKSPNPYVGGPPTPVGGNRLLEGSAELRYHTPIPNLALGFFFDIGRVWSVQAAGSLPLPEGASPTTQFGPGLGLRYYTPFGPARLDVAWRLTSVDQTPTEVQIAVDDVTNPADPKGKKIPGTQVFTQGVPGDSVRTAQSTNPNDYRITTDSTKCLPGTSVGEPHSYRCFIESRFQIFFTLGEAF